MGHGAAGVLDGAMDQSEDHATDRRDCPGQEEQRIVGRHFGVASRGRARFAMRPITDDRLGTVEVPPVMASRQPERVGISPELRQS